MLKQIVSILEEQLFHQRSEKKIEEFVPEDLQKFVNFSILQNKFLYRRRNKYRSYETLNISLFLHDESHILQTLKIILENIEENICLYVDFDGIFLSNDVERPFKFEYASKNTRFNQIFKIVDKKSATDFLSEFEVSHSQIVNQHFEIHKKILDYAASGFRPYCLLSMKIFIQTI